MLDEPWAEGSPWVPLPCAAPGAHAESAGAGASARAASVGGRSGDGRAAGLGSLPALARRAHRRADGHHGTCGRAWPARGSGGAALIQAVAIEDRIPCDEPPGWHAPVRQTLGAVLLQSGRAAEAEAVYREELRRSPGNGWSLYGLAHSLQAQGKPDAGQAMHSFRAGWARVGPDAGLVEDVAARRRGRAIARPSPVAAQAASRAIASDSPRRTGLSQPGRGAKRSPYLACSALRRSSSTSAPVSRMVWIGPPRKGA